MLVSGGGWVVVVWEKVRWLLRRDKIAMSQPVRLEFVI
jgi:hypothetical protein